MNGTFLKTHSLAALAVFLLLPGCSEWRANEVSSVSGTIEADEVRVASRYGGRVDKVSASEGDRLRTGQVIVELEAPELPARREQAAALLAELKAGARPEELAAAQSDWEAVAADLDLARLEARRALDLFQEKTIAAAERDRSVSRASSLEKSVAAARARYDLLKVGTRVERIAHAQALLAEIETQIGEMKIVAPTNCFLEVLSVRKGDVLAPNREVATLLLPHLWVRVFVPEPWLGHVKVGEQVTVRVDSFPGRDFPGQVEQIGRGAEFTPRNVQTAGERIRQVFGVKVRLSADDDRLRAGMAADVTFPNVPR